MALPAPAGGRGSDVTVSTGAVAVRLGWCWFRLLLDVLIYYGLIRVEEVDIGGGCWFILG